MNSSRFFCSYSTVNKQIKGIPFFPQKCLPFNPNIKDFISHFPYIALYFLIIAYVNSYGRKSFQILRANTGA